MEEEILLEDLVSDRMCQLYQSCGLCSQELHMRAIDGSSSVAVRSDPLAMM